jgi:O-antigen ligase
MTQHGSYQGAGTYDYLRTYLIIPALSWLSFVIAYRFAATSTDRATEYLRYAGISTLWYAAVMLGSVAYYFTQFRDFNLVRTMVGFFIGIHTNDFSFAFVMLAPFLIAGAISKNIAPRRTRLLFWLALIGVVVAVVFSYSRSAYVALALVTFGFALLVRRSLLWLLVPALAGLVLFAPASVLERAQFGFESAKSNVSPDWNDVSAGRLGMAEAALTTITSDVGQAAFGGGRLTFPRTTYHKFGVGHPHNAYLEVLLDAGVIGFVPIIALFLLLFSRAIKGMRRLHTSEYRPFYAAAVVSLGSYLIMGISGRSFFPSPQLVYVWQISGFALGLFHHDMLRANQRTQSTMNARLSSGRSNASQTTHIPAGNSSKCVG